MPNDVTTLLLQMSAGNEAAVNEIFPIIYDELRRIANKYLGGERVNHTLQPTALVHEAYLKLIDQTQIKWQNRAHFLGMGATIMRQILIDNARKHRAVKRGGAQENFQLDEALIVAGTDDSDEKAIDLLALDEALKKLAEFDAQKARIVELRYFGGLTTEETAEVLGVSEITVKRHWRMAKGWLFAKING